MKGTTLLVILVLCLPVLRGVAVIDSEQWTHNMVMAKNSSSIEAKLCQSDPDSRYNSVESSQDAHVVPAFSHGCAADEPLHHMESLENDTWILDTVDALGKISFDTSIAVDATDTIHISYHDFGEQNLKYATNNAGTWTVQNIDTEGDVGSYNAIALDADNIPHISYYDATNRDLKYATLANDAWYIHTVDATGDVGSYNAIALDADNIPHISYYDTTNRDLKYATFRDATWATESVDTTDEVGSFTDIVVDHAGTVHITYFAATTQTLRYAVGTMASWDITNAVTDVRVFGTTSITLDTQQTPHICYYDLTDFNIWYLKYAYPTRLGWVTEVVDPNLYYFWNAPGAGIAVDNRGYVHIGYAAWKGWNLNYAWRSPKGVWHVELVESEGNVGAFASLALDFNGYPHISYIDRSNSVLKYAHKIQYPPDIPVRPSGPSRIVTGKEYTYTTSTIDLDNDEVRYGWDWDGDRIVDEWTGFYTSSEQITVMHSWNISGTYGVRVLAEDSYGHQSNWSEPLSIMVPYFFDETHNLSAIWLTWFPHICEMTTRPLLCPLLYLLVVLTLRETGIPVLQNLLNP